MKPTVTPLGKVHVLPVASIKPAPDNPRTIPTAAIEITAKSIKRFGWQQPLVVDTNNVIIAGHTRLKAAKALGLTKVPVIVAESLTPEEAHAYRIADNRTADYTTWDYPELIKQLDELADEFPEELGLADWEGIIQEFEEREADDLAALDVDPEEEAITSMAHELVVVCESETVAKKITGLLSGQDGVVDVRNKR